MTSRPATRRSSTPCSRRFAGKDRSRWSISPAARDRRFGRSAARLPARQSWRLVDNDLGLLGTAATLARPPDVTVAATRGRPGARSRACARWADRSDHDVGAARSRLGGLARAADGRSGGAPAAGLCGAELRRAGVVRSAEPLRRRHRRGREPASARRQGVWPGARARRRARRGGHRQARRLFVRRGIVRLGVRHGRPGDPERSAARLCQCCGRAWRSSGRRALRIGWRGASISSPPAASSMRVGHVDFFAMPMPIR